MVVVTETPMATDGNKALIRRFFAEAVNQQDLSLLDAMVAPGFPGSGRDPGRGGTRGPEAVKATVRWVHGVFADLRYEVRDLIAEGDRVVARMEAHGVHRGEYLGVAGTGKPVTYSEVFIFRVADGKIAEWWITVDGTGILRQVGATVVPG
jgi:predicted ester cyclase